MYAVSTKKVAKKISRFVDGSRFANPPNNSKELVREANYNNNNQVEEKKTKKPSTIQIYSDDLHGSFYRRCAFSPDGQFFILTSGVITNNFKNYLSVGSHPSKKPIQVAFLYSTQIPSTFPDGNGIVFTSTDGYCTICEFSPMEIGTEIEIPTILLQDKISEQKELATEGGDLVDLTKNQQNLPISSDLEHGFLAELVDCCKLCVDAVKFFPAEKINVRVSNCCPEDIKTSSNTDITTAKKEPKRVPFITISKPS